MPMDIFFKIKPSHVVEPIRWEPMRWKVINQLGEGLEHSTGENVCALIWLVPRWEGICITVRIRSNQKISFFKPPLFIVFTFLFYWHSFLQYKMSLFAVKLMSSMYIPKLNHTQDLLSLKIVVKEENLF